MRRDWCTKKDKLEELWILFTKPCSLDCRTSGKKTSVSAQQVDPGNKEGGIITMEYRTHQLSIYQNNYANVGDDSINKLVFRDAIHLRRVRRISCNAVFVVNGSNVPYNSNVSVRCRGDEKKHGQTSSTPARHRHGSWICAHRIRYTYYCARFSKAFHANKVHATREPITSTVSRPDRIMKPSEMRCFQRPGKHCTMVNHYFISGFAVDFIIPKIQRRTSLFGKQAIIKIPD